MSRVAIVLLTVLLTAPACARRLASSNASPTAGAARTLQQETSATTISASTAPTPPTPSTLSAAAATVSTTDPFVGYFAHPAIGALELRRIDGSPRYHGKLGTILGWSPFEGSLDGNVVRGRVDFARTGGTSWPVDLERTASGFVLIDNGIEINPPLQWYDNEAEFVKWMKAHPEASK